MTDEGVIVITAAVLAALDVINDAVVVDDFDYTGLFDYEDEP